MKQLVEKVEWLRKRRLPTIKVSRFNGGTLRLGRVQPERGHLQRAAEVHCCWRNWHTNRCLSLLFTLFASPRPRHLFGSFVYPSVMARTRAAYLIPLLCLLVYIARENLTGTTTSTSESSRSSHHCRMALPAPNRACLSAQHPLSTTTAAATTTCAIFGRNVLLEAGSDRAHSAGSSVLGLGRSRSRSLSHRSGSCSSRSSSSRGSHRRVHSSSLVAAAHLHVALVCWALHQVRT